MIRLTSIVWVVAFGPAGELVERWVIFGLREKE